MDGSRQLCPVSALRYRDYPYYYCNLGSSEAQRPSDVDGGEVPPQFKAM